jgi:DNA-binding HxlR family transcriptional regulator
VYTTVPAQVIYELTPLGSSLTQLVKQLADWSRKHRAIIGRSRADYDAQHPNTPTPQHPNHEIH